MLDRVPRFVLRAVEVRALDQDLDVDDVEPGRIKIHGAVTAAAAGLAGAASTETAPSTGVAKAVTAPPSVEVAADTQTPSATAVLAVPMTVQLMRSPRPLTSHCGAEQLQFEIALRALLPQSGSRHHLPI